MSTLTSQRCAVCSAPFLNDQKWQATKPNTIRSSSIKRTTTKQDLK